MSGEYRPIPFRWVLPVAQLLLCVAILWPFRARLTFEIRTSLHAYRSDGRETQLPKISLRELYPDLLPDYSNLSAVIEARERIVEPSRLRLWAPVLLNVPAATAELPFSLSNPDGRYWVPKGMTLRVWQAISVPLIGLVLWWIVGRAIEALLAASRDVVRPKITWAELLAASVFVLIGIFALVSPIEADIRSEPEPPWIYLSTAGALWLICGTAIIASRVMQWRIRRRAAAASTSGAIPA